MVLQAHLKKHIIALGGWLLMYTSGPPRPPIWQKTIFFPDFFLLPSLSVTQRYVIYTMCILFAEYVVFAPIQHYAAFTLSV